MKIGKKELSLLFIVLGVVLVVGAFMYGNNLAGKTETLTSENASLDEEVKYLQDLMDHKQEYLDESDRMNAEMDNIKSQFPARVMPENTIMYANGLESRFEVYLDNISVQDPQLIGIEGSAAPAAAEAPAVEGEEGTEGAEGTAETTPSPSAIASAATTITLYRNSTNFEYESSYRGLKDMLDYVNKDEERKAIDSFDVAYDPETGNLKGSMSISMYSLDGTGKPYEEPLVTGVQDGRTQIISSAPTFNREGRTNVTGDSSTADGRSGSADSEE